MTRSAGSKRWTAAALLLVGCFGIYFWINLRPSLDAVPLLGPSAITLVPGVHLLGALEPSAAYVVETSEGLVLVDSGLESDAGLVKSQLDKLGLDASKIRAILLTHVHGDHCGGAEIIRSKTGARIYAGKGDIPFLRAGQPREAFFSIFAMPGHMPHPTTVDVELSDGGILDFGDARFNVISTPGHTEGSTCYLLEKSGLRILFGGDVITMLAGDGNPHSTGRKPLGTYSAYLAPRYHGDAEESLASLRKLRALPVPDLVLPGHPRSDPTPQNPPLSQKRWEEMLGQGISDMETLIARYKSDGRLFLDGIPKSIVPGLDYLGDFQGKAVYVLTANTKRFLINAPGGPGLLTWVNERSKTLGTVASRDIFALLLTACGPEETEGLKTLVEATKAKVVVSSPGVETIKALCPGAEVIAAEDLANQRWFDVKVVPLQGRGIAPLAYVMKMAGKTILISGRIPILFDQASMNALGAELPARVNALEYLLSIRTLEKIKPDIWLPLVPSDGQNANVYDVDWTHTIETTSARGTPCLRTGLENAFCRFRCCGPSVSKKSIFERSRLRDARNSRNPSRTHERQHPFVTHRSATAHRQNNMTICSKVLASSATNGTHFLKDEDRRMV